MTTKKQMLALGGLILLFAAFGLLYVFTRPAASTGEKQITISIVHQNGETRELHFTTQTETLGDLLCEQPGLIEYADSSFGRYIRAVDGEAEDTAEQLWWCITKNGQPHDAGMDATMLADGDRYELTLRKGYTSP